MFEKLGATESRFEEINQRLMDPTVVHKTIHHVYLK